MTQPAKQLRQYAHNLFPRIPDFHIFWIDKIEGYIQQLHKIHFTMFNAKGKGDVKGKGDAKGKGIFKVEVREMLKGRGC